ncbi:MAG: VOC family protein [Alphaproteobacteria bacterium]|nr:VOC family protein [Alphaproteobacteria bacterium]
MSLNYIMVGSNDIARSRKFYDAVFAHLKAPVVFRVENAAICYAMPDGGRVWISRPYNREPAVPGNGSMPGFLCASEAAVNAAHAAGLKNGGTSEGDPGPRPLYGPEFYGAYLRDPDGNKMSVFFNRPK